MSKVMNKMTAVWRDEAGGEILEYVLIAGLIIVAAVTMITAVGGKALARWSSVNASL